MKKVRVKMINEYTGKEKREFVRYEYKKPIHCRSIKSSKDKKSFSSLIKGMVKNFSASGILFEINSDNVPKISDLLLLELEYRTANICKEIERQALIARNKFFGKIVRIKNNFDGTCDIAVALIPKYSHIPEDIKILIESE